VVETMVVGAQRHQVGGVAGATVAPVDDVVHVDPGGVGAAGKAAAAVAVLHRPSEPPVDRAEPAALVDRHARPLEDDPQPGVAGHVAGHRGADRRAGVERRLLVARQRTQAVDVEVQEDLVTVGGVEAVANMCSMIAALGGLVHTLGGGVGS